MNKTHRSVWNESLGAWVATSELTKAKGKRSGGLVAAINALSTVAATAALFTMSMLAIPAAAQSVGNGNNGTIDYEGTAISNANGRPAITLGSYGVIIGNASYSPYLGYGATVIGWGAGNGSTMSPKLFGPYGDSTIVGTQAADHAVLGAAEVYVGNTAGAQHIALVTANGTPGRNTGIGSDALQQRLAPVKAPCS